MVRGLYTAASGMVAQQTRMDVVANNLANVNSPGFKKDVALMKAFPEMLMRRTGADGIVEFPLGSYDRAPVAGKIGTGVEVNDIRTDFSNGLNVKYTGQDFDLALQGDGFFTVETPEGERYTRAGNFTLDENGFLVTQEGFRVLSDRGPVIIQRNNFRVDEFGQIITNARFDGANVVERSQNSFDQEQVAYRLRLVTFTDNRELIKEGSGLFSETQFSGSPVELNPGQGRPSVSQGYLETSNVEVVEEMVAMISTQRAYEAGARAMKGHEETLGLALTQVMRV